MSDSPKADYKPEPMEVGIVDDPENFDMGITNEGGQGVIIVFNTPDGGRKGLVFRDEACDKFLTGCYSLLNLFFGTTVVEESHGDAVPNHKKPTLH